MLIMAHSTASQKDCKMCNNGAYCTASAANHVLGRPLFLEISVEDGAFEQPAEPGHSLDTVQHSRVTTRVLIALDVHIHTHTTHILHRCIIAQIHSIRVKLDIDTRPVNVLHHLRGRSRH